MGEGFSAVRWRMTCRGNDVIAISDYEELQTKPTTEGEPRLVEPDSDIFDALERLGECVDRVWCALACSVEAEEAIIVTAWPL